LTDRTLHTILESEQAMGESVMARSRRMILFYITHIENVPSILERGILCHEIVEREGIQYTPVYDPRIVARRRERKAPDGRDLWSFANLYFQPRNPMLYKVLLEQSPENIVILAVRADILNPKDVFISTGNAASLQSEILVRDDGVKAITRMADVLDLEWWSREDGSSRKIMAECLVPDRVPPEYIQAIYVASHEAAAKAREATEQWGIQIIPEPHMFFRPSRVVQVTPNMSLVQGDMFFSRMHTLTVSVNCVGVMGKGLASSAKYRFPDVYVFYQDLCRKKILRIGKPYLYKRESSSDDLLADEPATLTNGNPETWFLLFPTKHHWREQSSLPGIEQGLQWLQSKYKEEGVKSLAIPALGCGLGRLQWRDVGPLICRYLASLDIPVWLYLPAEQQVPEEMVSKEFLLG